MDNLIYSFHHLLGFFGTESFTSKPGVVFASLLRGGITSTSSLLRGAVPPSG